MEPNVSHSCLYHLTCGMATQRRNNGVNLDICHKRPEHRRSRFSYFAQCRPIELQLTTSRKVYLMRKIVGRRFAKAEPHQGANPGKKSCPLEHPCNAG